MVRTLFGVETEYAITGIAPSGASTDRSRIAGQLVSRARAQHAYLNDPGGGIFLQNGGRFYVDCGTHPEYATPECTDPWEAVRQIRAGEQIMHQLATGIALTDPDLREVSILRSNVDYQGATWGCHESYLHRTEPLTLPRQMVPHFVSRVIYSGAGGFVPDRSKLEFTMSPRAWFLKDGVSTKSTADRTLFHVRGESLSSRPYHRLHVICAESLCSETATLLKLGTTALILATVDAGYRPGDGVQLRTPADSLRLFASDPRCEVKSRLMNGRQATALDIQRHYLETVETCRAAGHLPAWSETLCRVWREQLELLEDAPDSVARTLDWGIKLALFRQWSANRLDWSSLSQWAETWQQIRPAIATAGEQPAPRSLRRDPDLDSLLSEGSPIRHRLPELERELASKGQSLHGLRTFLQLQRELFEIDLRFGAISPCGIFSQLDSAGLLPHRVVLKCEIERACSHPPKGSRAEVRGKWIANYRRPGDARCTWSRISVPGERFLDLSDPFATTASWQKCGEPKAISKAVANLQRELFTRERLREWF